MSAAGEAANRFHVANRSRAGGQGTDGFEHIIYARVLGSGTLRVDRDLPNVMSVHMARAL